MTNKAVLAISASAIVVASSILCAVFILHQNQEKDDLALETNATIGIMPGVDLDQRLKELQTRLDESKIAFSINSSPLFHSATDEGNLMLENPENNAKLISAEVVLNSTNESVYTSKALVPGSYLDTIKLDRHLPSGVYDATVYLKAYREQTHELIGQTGAEITITVTD